jgi:hypothetical protein
MSHRTRTLSTSLVIAGTILAGLSIARADSGTVASNTDATNPTSDAFDVSASPDEAGLASDTRTGGTAEAGPPLVGLGKVYWGESDATIHRADLDGAN